MAESIRRRRQWLAWPNRRGLHVGAVLWLVAQGLQVVSVATTLLGGWRRMNSRVEEFFLDLRAPWILPDVWGPGIFSFGRSGWRAAAAWSELVAISLWTLACWRLAGWNNRAGGSRLAAAVRRLTLAALVVGVTSTGRWYDLRPAELWWCLSQVALRREMF